MDEEYNNVNNQPDEIINQAENSTDEVKASDTTINETVNEATAQSTSDSTPTQTITGATAQNPVNESGISNPAQPQEQTDPYSKYNFYRNQQYSQSYQNTGYQAQAYPNNGYQTSGYQNPGYTYTGQQAGTQYGQQSTQQYGQQAPAQSGTQYEQPAASQPNTQYGQQTAAQPNTQYGQQAASQSNTQYSQQAVQQTGFQYSQQPGQQAGYNTTNPQYNGTYSQSGYQNTGYQNPQQGYNPYPAGSISYVNNVDSIYPGTAPHRNTEKKPKSKAAKFFAGLAMSAVFGLVAAGVFILVTYFYKQENPDLFNNSTQPVQVTTTENKNDTHLNLDPAEGTTVPSTSVIDGATFTGTDVSKVVEENMPAIVAIDCITKINSWYGTQEAPSAGSGIIIEKNDKELMIATNNHVVADTTDIKVKFIDGTSAPAKIKGKDDVADLAVLSIELNDISKETLDAITIAKIGNSDDMKVGEMAIAIGNALGYGQSVTVGYISGKDREVTIDRQKFTGLLQTDAAINPGNSGGALLNLKGEVIGINNAKITGSDVEGMGYAIPISKALDILNDFMSRETLSREEQGYLGISVLTVTDELSKMYNWPNGAYISQIIEGEAASKSGLMVGDVITEVDGYPVKTSDVLIEKLQSLRAGTSTTLTVKRRIDGEFQEVKIDVVLGHRPAEDSKAEKTDPVISGNK